MPSRLQIGTLIFGGEAVVPPENGVLYRPSKENSAPKIVDTQTGKAITWIVVGGKLMADRCLLRDISYFTIDTEFLAGPVQNLPGWPRIYFAVTQGRKIQGHSK